MWTPTVKTRKFMTERRLRFDDIPIPGPLDEGEGGPGDGEFGIMFRRRLDVFVVSEIHSRFFVNQSRVSSGAENSLTRNTTVTNFPSSAPKESSTCAPKN